MTQKELETLIDERARKQADEAPDKNVDAVINFAQFLQNGTSGIEGQTEHKDHPKTHEEAVLCNPFVALYAICHLLLPYLTYP